jgi:hypothetical protein
MFKGELAFAALFIVGAILQNDTTPYPRMAPVDQYLMADRNAEIALARTAAPESVSRDATILVLGRHGYETAVKGKNGFVCAVQRAWMGPFDHPEFWNPKNRSPVCFNPPAARSVLPGVRMRTELVLAGLPKAQIIAALKAAYANKKLPALEPDSMSYMMSKAAYLTDNGSHNLAHLMFFAPRGARWGQDLDGSPPLTLQTAPVDPFTVLMVPVGKWSDGTPAPIP